MTEPLQQWARRTFIHDPSCDLDEDCTCDREDAAELQYAGPDQPSPREREAYRRAAPLDNGEPT